MFTTHDVQLLLVDLALILVLARLLGAAARRIGQPPVVGEVIAGILLGPTFFHGAVTRHLFPVELKPVLSGIADVGLVLFMFIVGYELDRSLIRGRERQAASISLGSIVVPMGAGFGLGLWLALHNDHKGVVPFALFVGASMSVTAFPVLARILTDRGLHRTRLGGLAIASAAVDDIAAWSLLAVVVTIAGVPGTEQWHILLAPAYLLVMALLVRPLMKQVGERVARIGRLTPDVLGVVLVVLLLSSFATEWMGVHFIFGAFIAGAVMPREAAEALREAILERLEQISVLLLLPVFFVVSGSAVDLSAIDGGKLVELLAILGVVIGGKFLGAYLGGRSAGVPNRQAGALATLMNTRGLTELIILNVGLQNGVIAPPLFTLLVVMAVLTTAMTGPLLRLIYPERLINRDIADAERAALADASYRVIAVLDPQADAVADAALMRAAVDLAVVRAPAQVVSVRLLAQQDPAKRLELGAGLGTQLLAMTQAMSRLHELAAESARGGVTVSAYAQFSDDITADLTRYVINAEPDLVVLTGTVELLPHELTPRIVVHGVEPAQPSAVAVALRADSDGDTALQVAAQLAVARDLPLVLLEAGRRERGVAAELSRRGIRASAGDVPEGALVVGPHAGPGTHLVTRARPDDEIGELDEWAELLSAGRHAAAGSSQ